MINMCQRCLNVVQGNIRQLIGNQIETATGVPFTVVSLIGNRIYIQTSQGNSRNFHFDHLTDCYHWMDILKKRIAGVGSSPISIRGLIGNNGALLKCSLCERNPAYIWGILATIPNVKRRGNTLFV